MPPAYKKKIQGLRKDPDAEEIVSLINRLYHNNHLHTIGVDGWTEAKDYVSDKNTLRRYLMRFKKSFPKLQNAPVTFLIPIFMKPLRICRTKCRIYGIYLPHQITNLIIMPSSGLIVAYHLCGTIRCSSEATPGQTGLLFIIHWHVHAAKEG